MLNNNATAAGSDTEEDAAGRDARRNEEEFQSV